MCAKLYVPSHLAIEAMRDSGYKNTAFALAELIDNSIQAKADLVELMCGEREHIFGPRRSKRVEQIAVLDNGEGMNEDVLYKALQFGNGTRFGRSGMGRFGVGLPASSISQCKRVEVWTWQNGIENAVYTYLDVEEVKSQVRDSVPKPDFRTIPEYIQKIGNQFGESGTLIVWSVLDRLMWKTARAVIKNSELLVGRLYRRFLNNKDVSIRLAAFDLDNLNEVAIDKNAKPNDPIYLMENNSCPEPFESEPMFKPHGSDIVHKIEFMGEEHEVRIKVSYAKEEARTGYNPGSKPHGKHAKENVGVSIVRAGRELELNQSLVNQYDPTERWWGIEIDFPPSLDELFGVTNNKQFARNFSDIASLDIEALQREEGKTINEIKEEMNEEGDPRGPLLEIVQSIRREISVLRRLIDTQKKGTSKKRYDDEEFSVEKTATEHTRRRQESGHKGSSDEEEKMPPDKRKEEITKDLKDSGLTQGDAEQLAARTVSSNYKYVFVNAELEGSAFFSVQPRAGSIIIKLNTKHPVCYKLVETLNISDVEDADNIELSNRLTQASEALWLLLTAWARFEDEKEGRDKQFAEDVRNDWGRIARNFLQNDH